MVSSKMELFTVDSGRMATDRAGALRCGKMALTMKDIGATTKLTAKDV